MDIVYRYVDNKDNIVKYVGITGRTLQQRVDEHRKLDSWVDTTQSWRIEYFLVNNKSESEAWESHLIALYKTYNWFNKAKKDWGIIKHFENLHIDWKIYSDTNDIIDINYDYYSVVDNTDGLVSDLTLSLDFDIPLLEIHRLVSRRELCPVARTDRNRLLFIESDIEKLVDCMRSVR